MTEKQPRQGLLGALDKAYAFVEGARGLVMILSALSAGGITGTVLASDGDTAARVDSLAAEFDSLATELDSVKAQQARQDQRQMDMFTAQVEADTAIRAVLERRAENKFKA